MGCLAGCNTQVPLGPVGPEKYLEQLHTSIFAIENADNLIQTLTLTCSRTIEGQALTQSSQQTVWRQNLHSAAPVIYREEDISFGSYRTQIRRLYKARTAFVIIGEKTFSGRSKAAYYLQSLVPAVLFQPENYASVTAYAGENGIVLTFQDATALENWVTDGDAILLSATATATLDASGNLLECSYQAAYTQDDIPYALDTTSRISTPEQLDISNLLPHIPANRVLLSDPELPVQILQAVGDLYAVQEITSGYAETIECDAIRTKRQQQTQLQLSCDKNDLAADITYNISLSDYSGNTTAAVTTERYRSGSLTTATNGKEITDNISPQDMKTRCEDLLLLSMFAISYLEDAEIQIQDGLCHISMTGTQQLNDRLCQSIYALLGVDLDTLSSGHTDEPATGYLTLDARTGFPVAAGMTVKRTHVINGAFQALTYQLNQTYSIKNEPS